jgi:UDP-2,3-diacylglucosamine pyrophosphatase LpxH
LKTFAISDLHCGDGGPRDNFACGNHEKDLLSFLDMVEDEGGKLVVGGDLFELWQSNISKVITKRICLLDRLAAMGAIYVLGNHDADLRYFKNYGRQWLNHPFFRTMCDEYLLNVNDTLFYFIHGHQADAYCAGDTPGLGRITAIYSGLAEDKNGSPMLDKYRTVEDKVVGRLEKLVSLWNRFRGKPDRFTEINRALRYQVAKYAAHAVICGHTHFPGQYGGWLYNTGTWAERTNSFVRIDDDGSINVFDWANGRATLNHTTLPM